MPRPIWSGSITFGLVTIPVALFSATEDHTIHFNQFERGTSDRIRYRRINERTGDEVPYADIVKGREMTGDVVIIEQDELDEIAPGRSRSIDIEAFVDLDEIDPVFYQKTYWLGPTDEQYARPYGLLLEAMTRTNRAGVATFVMRGRQYLTAIRAQQGVLALETLYFADEVRDPAEVLTNIPEGGSKGKELDMAVTLVESMSAPWQPEDYRDTYTERVEKLLDDKRGGREVTAEAAAPDATEVVDLVEALRRSVEKSRAGRTSKAAAPEAAPAPAEDLSGLTKTELDARARELGVRGRSKMNRDELVEALAAASPAETSKAS